MSNKVQIILALTIPLCFCLMFLSRWITGEPLNENAVRSIDDVLKVIIGGLIGSKLSEKSNKKAEK